MSNQRYIETLPEPCQRLRKLMIEVNQLVIDLNQNHPMIDFDIIKHLASTSLPIMQAGAILERNMVGDYETYLKSDQWLNIRERVAQRDKGTCQRCNAVWTPISGMERFHVHHITYARRGLEDLEDLVLLCPSCHLFVHESGMFSKGRYRETEAELDALLAQYEPDDWKDEP